MSKHQSAQIRRNKNRMARRSQARRLDNAYRQLESRQLMVGDLFGGLAAGGTLDDGGQSVAIDSDGFVYTTGYFRQTVDFDPGEGVVNLTSNGASDVFVTKMAQEGELVWARSFGAGLIDQGSTIKIGNDGNIFVGGRFDGTVDFDPGAGINLTSTAGLADAFIVKLSPAGNYIWSRTFGGAGIDILDAMVIDKVGNIYTTGHFYGTSDFAPGKTATNLTSVGSSDIFVTRLTSTGNLSWARRVGGTESELATSLTLDGSGNLYAGGIFGGTVDFDPGSGVTNLTTAAGEGFVLKLNATTSAFQWARQMGGFVLDIEASGSNVFVSGSFRDTQDFDPSTAINNLTSSGGYDAFFTKLTSSGGFDWAQRYGGTGDDAASSVEYYANSIYLGGTFQGLVDFNPNAGILNLSSRGGLDIFTARMTIGGDPYWVRQQGGGEHDVAFEMAIGPMGIIASTGQFSGTMDFDPAGTGLNATSMGSNDIFVSVLTQDMIFRQEGKADERILIRRNGSNLEIYNQSSPRVLASRPLLHVLGVQGYGSRASERLTVDWSFGGQFVLQNGVRYEGDFGFDQVYFVGNNSEAVTFESLSVALPSTIQTGEIHATSSTGSVLTIATRNTEAGKVSRIGSLTYQSQGSRDDLIAANGAGLFGNTGTRISGTSDFLDVMSFTFDSVPSVRIDLGTKDLSDRPNDRITFNGAIGARGLQNLTVATGIGDDDLMVYYADLRLALAGGEFWFEDGTGFDRLMVRGDTNWRLNDDRLLSDAGGRIRIAGVEQVYMTGGAGNNELTAVGFSGSVTLDGDAGNDILRGTNQHDAIFGRGGMDQIFGGKGNDLIDGGSEADTIYFDGTTENDDVRLQYVSSSSANFRRKLRDTTAVLELDLLTYDSADRFEVRALGGNDLLTIDLAFGILGTVNGGDGTDTCTAPAAWTRISCEG